MIPMVVMMGTIFFLSHQPGCQLNIPQIEYFDKFGHAVIYGLLAVTAILAAPVEVKRRRPKVAVIIVIIFCFFYGISDEFHQSFIPQRSVSEADLVADLFGSVLVCSLWLRKQLS